MGKLFAIWFVSLSLWSIHLFCQEIDDEWLWEGDTSLILLADEPEQFVSMTGELCLLLLNKDPENQQLGTYDCWILKMNPESLEIACSTPVHGAFQSPESIRSNPRCNELELAGNFDKKWLQEHRGQTVTLTGYLWHGHTAHHLTPVILDTDPWFK